MPTWLKQALMVIVVIVLVMALLQVLQARFRFDPVMSIARPFFPVMPDSPQS